MALNPIASLRSMFASVRVRLANPQRYTYGFPGLNNAGVRVTSENATQVAAVWACMDVIASAASSSDWNVYAGVRHATNKEALPDDSLQYILNTRFNREMTAQAGKRAMMLAAVGYKDGYAEIERDMAGRIVALWPIAPNRVDPRRDLDTGRLFYRVTQEYSGGWVDMEPDELFIIRGASLVGFSGDDAIGRAIQSIASAIAIDQFAASYFANGTQLGGVLEYEKKLDDPSFERLQGQWNGKHQGSRNAFKTAILENGVKFNPITTDAEKSQIVNVKHLSIEEICRWFRVPPHKIAHLLRATNNNIEHQGLEFSRDTLRPWIKEIEQEADYKLIAYRGPKKFVEIDVDWAEQGDYKSRAEAYATLAGTGAFSPNMILQKLGENTIGKDGDIHFVNGAAIPLDQIGAAYAQSQAKPPALPAPDAPAQEDTAQAWLTSVYARIQRRFDNRSRADSVTGALADARTYGPEQVAELAGVLGDRLEAAQAMAFEMVSGVLLPEEAAAKVFDKEAA